MTTGVFFDLGGTLFSYRNLPRATRPLLEETLRRLDVTHHALPKRREDDRGPGVDVGVFGGELGGDALRVGTSRGDIDARSQPSRTGAPRTASGPVSRRATEAPATASGE